MYNFKNKNKSTNTLISHIGLEPMSSHTIKYSQPIEQVLFHVIPIRV